MTLTPYHACTVSHQLPLFAHCSIEASTPPNQSNTIGPFSPHSHLSSTQNSAPILHQWTNKRELECCGWSSTSGFMVERSRRSCLGCLHLVVCAAERLALMPPLSSFPGDLSSSLSLSISLSFDLDLFAVCLLGSFRGRKLGHVHGNEEVSRRRMSVWTVRFK